MSSLSSAPAPHEPVSASFCLSPFMPLRAPCDWVFSLNQSAGLVSTGGLTSREAAADSRCAAIIHPRSTSRRSTMLRAPAWGERWLWDWAQKAWHNWEWCLVAGMTSHIFILDFLLFFFFSGIWVLASAPYVMLWNINIVQHICL